MRPFTQVIIKAFAAYMVLSAISDSITPMLFLTPDALKELPMTPLIGWIAVPFVIGIVLWVASSKIANKLHPKSSEANITESGIVSAGTFLIGIYWLTGSAGRALGEYSATGKINYGHASIILISIILIIGSRFITHMYHKLKKATTNA